MKWRNSKERELLSQGGTREQTLPSKDNQNPDLSDPLEQSRDTEMGEAAGMDKSGLKHYESHADIVSDSTWENRRLDSLDMMHGISCSGDMGEEDFYDEEDEDIEDGDEEEISVT